MTEDYRDITELLRTAKHKFHYEMSLAVGEAARILNIDDIHEEDFETQQDMVEIRHHCGTCMTNEVITRTEPILLEYLSLLETVVGLDPNDRIATEELFTE